MNSKAIRACLEVSVGSMLLQQPGSLRGCRPPAPTQLCSLPRRFPRARFAGRVRATAEQQPESAAPISQEHLDAQVAVVLGTQWGDEGKGKLVDVLAGQYDVVARAQVHKAHGPSSPPPTVACAAAVP